MCNKYLLTGILVGLLLTAAASAQVNADWQKANGGWIVVKNSHIYNTGGPFIPCPGQTDCMGYPVHVEHGVCIDAVTFDDPSVGSSWTPPDNGIILAKDCGANEWMDVDCPVVTEFWVPAGTYTLTEFTYVSEVNPGDPGYSPCTNAWSRAPRTVVIKPGDVVDFGETVFMEGPCTVGGYPCSDGPLGSTSGSSVGRADLGGNWKMGGPYNAGRPCQIIQQGNTLTFINENGDRSAGEFTDSATVVATDWEGGLSGAVSAEGDRIDWANKTWWVR
ncbi:MAG: hypothetical protein GYA39_07855 [Methanothrix sp.]|nr:hypothetical protein [Methanothrix sp.]